MVVSGIAISMAALEMGFIALEIILFLEIHDVLFSVQNINCPN